MSLGNLLRKSFAHYHAVMERHAYMSTPPLNSLCPLGRSVGPAVISGVWLALFLFTLLHFGCLTQNVLDQSLRVCENVSFVLLAASIPVMSDKQVNKMASYVSLAEFLHNANVRSGTYFASVMTA